MKYVAKMELQAKMKKSYIDDLVNSVCEQFFFELSTKMSNFGNDNLQYNFIWYIYGCAISNKTVYIKYAPFLSGLCRT